MSHYQVREGETVRWPDGSVRAESGEIFDGYDTSGDPAVRGFARKLMRGQWGSVEITFDATTVDRPMPDEIFAAFRAISAEPVEKAVEAAVEEIAEEVADLFDEDSEEDED